MKTKVTPKIAKAIRDRLLAGETQKSVADDFGLHQATVSRVWLGPNHSHARRSSPIQRLELTPAQIRRLVSDAADGVLLSDLAGRFGITTTEVNEHIKRNA